MTTYYVSPAGSDSNNGLGPDASDATNRPWATIAKALGASGIASGDTVYLAPGTYREAVTVAMTSATAETKVLGDPVNGQGFKDGSGNPLAPAHVVWTAYTTNDTTAPAASNCLNTNFRDWLTFEKIRFQGGGATNVVGAPSGASSSVHLTFRDCVFLNGGGFGCLTLGTGSDGAAQATLVERCTFLSAFRCINITLAQTSSGAADYDADITIRECLLLNLDDNSAAVEIGSSGSTTFKAGGVDVKGCTILSGFMGVRAGAGLSTSVACTVAHSLVVAGNTCLNASSAGMLTEDYNVLGGPTTVNANITAGTNSKSGNPPPYSPLLDLFDSVLFDFPRRPLFEPTVGSPLLGFSPTGASPAPSSTDLANRPRPSGGGSLNAAVGALERHDVATRELSVVDAGGVGLRIAGPGDQDILVPVAAESTTISVMARYDSNHGNTNPPQALLLANGEIGVAAQTVTMAAAVDTWEQLSFSAITPTANGVVVVRLRSRPAAANGVSYWDTLQVS